MFFEHLLCNLTGQVNKLNGTIDWDRVENILLAHYTVGTSGEGADAYPPFLLFKCMLLQKWFRINSIPDSKTRSMIACPLKGFSASLSIGLRRIIPPSPAFRSRLSKNAMDKINSEILRQFKAKGLTINEGIAVDARIVKSASRPISKKDIDELKKKRNTPQGKLDKNLSRYKSSR